MNFPKWVIPSNIDRSKLLEEAQYLLKQYQAGTYPFKHICSNCSAMNLPLLLATVNASLKLPNRSLESNMIPTVDTITCASETMRGEWLQLLVDLLKGVTTNATP